MTIGVLTQLIGTPFYDTIAQGVIAGLSGTGYWPIFVDGQWKKDEETDGIRALIGRQVDGLVLIGGDIDCDEITELCDDLPLVIAARNLTDHQHHCVHMDNVDGGYRATKHLLEHGHRNIAIIRGLKHHPDAIDRFTGYKQALEEFSIPLEPNLILDGDFSAESGVACTDQLIRSKQPFTAIVAANDITAFGARLSLYRHGISVPDQVSLIGFDDQMESAFTTPPLTTIRQPAREMGEQAARAVLAIINGDDITPDTVKGELIERESVSGSR